MTEQEKLEQTATMLAKDIAQASLTQEVFARQIQSIQQCAWVPDAKEKLEVLNKLHQKSQTVVATLFAALEQTITQLADLSKKS
jgi:hypothetical protein